MIRIRVRVRVRVHVPPVPPSRAAARLFVFALPLQVPFLAELPSNPKNSSANMSLSS